MSRGLNPAVDMQSVMRLRKIIKKENPALVHLHSSKAGFLGRIACRQAGYTSIFTPHAVSYLSFNGVKRKKLFSIGKNCKKFTDKILAVSHSESKILQEQLGYNFNDIFVIPNSLIIQENKSYIEKGLYKLDAKLKVGTIGRLTPQKNPLLFTDIAADVINALGNEVHFLFFRRR